MLWDIFDTENLPAPSHRGLGQICRRLGRALNERPSLKQENTASLSPRKKVGTPLRHLACGQHLRAPLPNH